MSTISAPYTPQSKAVRLFGEAFLMAYVFYDRDSEGVETPHTAPENIAFEITNPQKPGFLLEIPADSPLVTIATNRIELSADTPYALGLTLSQDSYFPQPYRVRLFTIDEDTKTRLYDVELKVVKTMPPDLNEEGVSGAEVFRLVYTPEGTEEGVTVEVRGQLESRMTAVEVLAAQAVTALGTVSDLVAEATTQATAAETSAASALTDADRAQVQAESAEADRVLADQRAADAEYFAGLSEQVALPDGVITPEKTSFSQVTDVVDFGVTDELGNLSFSVTDGKASADEIAARLVNGAVIAEAPEVDFGLIDESGYYSFSVLDGSVKSKETDSQTLKVDSKVAFESDGSGGLIVRNLLTDAVILSINPAGQLTLSDLVINSGKSDAFAFALADPAGNVAFGVTRDGGLVGVSGGVASAETEPTGITADILYLPDYGQSLSVGAYGTPLVHTEPEDYVIGFNKGPVLVDYDDDPTQYDAFVLLVETTQETPVSALARMFKQQLATDGFVINDTTKRLEILSAAPGLAGASIAELSKDTDPYNRFVLALTKAKELAASDGKTLNVPLVFWMQGEQNVNSSQEAYKASLQVLRDDLAEEVQTINPAQSNTLKFLTYQVASHNQANAGAGAYPNVALALLDLGLNDPNFFMGPPLYPYDYEDDVHLTSGAEYAKVGAIAGYIEKRIVVDGVNWKPIHLRSWVIDGTILQLRLNVPVLPLVFDTTTVTDPGNYGFRLFSGLTEQTISSVTLTRPDTIRIVCASPVVAGMKLTYAINGTLGKSGRTQGSRGCLRDSQGDTIRYDPSGLNYPLHNWTPIFEQTL